MTRTKPSPKYVDPRVPALQLLLSDATDYERKELFAQAFSRACIPRTDARIVERMLRDAKGALDNAADTKAKEAHAYIHQALGIIVLNID